MATMTQWMTTLFLMLVLGMAAPKLQAQTAQQKAAEQFGLSLIQSYFDHNCAYVADHLGEQLYSLEAGQTFPVTPKMRQTFCKTSPLRTDVPVSFEHYQTNYAPKVYDKVAFEKAFPAWAGRIQWQAGDLFFDGSRPRAAGHTRLFKSEGQARFLLRRQGDSWLIVGL